MFMAGRGRWGFEGLVKRFGVCRLHHELPLAIEGRSQGFHPVAKSIDEFFSLELRQSLKHESKLGEIKRGRHGK